MEQTSNQKSFATAQSNVFTTTNFENYDLKVQNPLCSLFLMSFACHSYAICMSVVCTCMSHVCQPYVTALYSYVSRMSLVCVRIWSIYTHMPYLCHSHVLVCIRMSIVCTRMSSVCHLYALVCHPYVTRMYLYVIRVSLVSTRTSSLCHSYVVLPWTISNIVARGDDLKEKGKTLSNILIEACKKKITSLILTIQTQIHRGILIEVGCTSTPIVGQYL